MFFLYMSDDVRGREVINFVWAHPEAQTAIRITVPGRWLTTHTKLMGVDGHTHWALNACGWSNMWSIVFSFCWLPDSPTSTQALPSFNVLANEALAMRHKEQSHLFSASLNVHLKPNFGCTCNIESGVNMCTRLSFYSLHETQIYWLRKSA